MSAINWTEEELEEELEHLDICDHCGLEADPVVPVFTAPEFEIRRDGAQNEEGVPVSDVFSMSDLQKEMMQAFIDEVSDSTNQAHAKLHFKNQAEICKDCYTELFEWRQQ